MNSPSINLATTKNRREKKHWEWAKWPLTLYKCYPRDISSVQHDRIGGTKWVLAVEECRYLELQKKGGRAVEVETSLREVWTSCHFLDNQPQAYHPSLFIKSLHIHYLIKFTQQFFSFVCPFHNWRNWDWTKWNDLSATKSHRQYENLRLSMLSPKRSPTLTRL